MAGGARFVSVDRREGKDGTGMLTITTRLDEDSDGDTAKDTEMLVGVPHAAVADRLMRAMMHEGSARLATDKTATRTQ